MANLKDIGSNEPDLASGTNVGGWLQGSAYSRPANGRQENGNVTRELSATRSCTEDFMISHTSDSMRRDDAVRGEVPSSDAPQWQSLDYNSSRAWAARDVTKRAVAWAGCILHRLMGRRLLNRFGILMYHRVSDPVAGLATPTWNVTPASFRDQMTGLLSRGFEPWSLKRLITERKKGLPQDAKVFAVTFDDGFESVYKSAWPVLREYKIPATIFLSTAYLDQQQAFPFDDWAEAGSDRVPADSYRPLTTEQCLTMAADGLVELGAHTHTHRDFTRHPREFAADLAENVAVLRSQLGVARPLFAFPYGRATKEMLKIVADAGCSCALTTYGVPADPNRTPFDWGRFHVERWDTAETLAAKISGWGTASALRRPFTRWRRPELVSG
jgi:peptidoglycan/xylan/chitin deacetylase (PgdA/CDA1 family)